MPENDETPAPPAAPAPAKAEAAASHVRVRYLPKPGTPTPVEVGGYWWHWGTTFAVPRALVKELKHEHGAFETLGDAPDPTKTP